MPHVHVNGGTLDVVSAATIGGTVSVKPTGGTIAMLQAGTITTLPAITGTVAVSGGTIGTLPAITGTVAVSAGTITTLPAITGTVAVSGGTIGTLPAITGTVTANQGTAGAAAWPVSVTPPSALVHGQTTVATAGAEQALGTSTVLYSGVCVKALHANTGWIYVGANPVTSTTGFVLDAGEERFLEVANLATVFIDVSVNGEGVSYIGS